MRWLDKYTIDNIGKFLKEIRESSGKSIYTVEGVTGFYHKYVSDVENGVTYPTYEYSVAFKDCIAELEYVFELSRIIFKLRKELLKIKVDTNAKKFLNHYNHKKANKFPHREIGAILLDIKKNSGFSNRDFCTIMGRTREAVRAQELGKSLPKNEYLVKLERMFKTNDNAKQFDELKQLIGKAYAERKGE